MEDNTYVFDYVRESCESFINKRSKAEKKILAAALHFPRDLRKIILGYSRISGKFVRDYSYWVSTHPKKLWELSVKNISINLVSISQYSITKFGISIKFTPDRFCLLHLFNEPCEIILHIAPWDLFFSFMNMDTRKIVDHWRRDLRERMSPSKYSEILNYLPNIADDAVQFLIWY